MRIDRSRPRAAACGVDALEPRRLFAVGAGPLPIAHVPTSYDVGDILADPVRNRVYVADKTNASIHVIDTDLAKEVATINLVGVPNELAITPDDASLVVTVGDAGEVQIVSPTTFHSIRVIDTGAASLWHPVAGVGGKLYAIAGTPADPGGQYLRQFDLTTGAAGATLSGNDELISAIAIDRAGTHLYVRPYVFDAPNVIDQFDVSNPTSIAAPRSYANPADTTGDLYVDADAARLYLANNTASFHAVALGNGAATTLDDDSSVDHLFGVAGYANSPSVYALTSASIVQFDKATGAPVYRYKLPKYSEAREASLVATPNGRLMYVETKDDFENTGYGEDVMGLGIVGAATLPLAGSPSSIRGTVFADANFDGAREKKERGKALDAYVYLDLNGNGEFDQGYGDDTAEPNVYLIGTGDGTFDITVPGTVSGTYAVRIADENPGGTGHTNLVVTTANSAVTVGSGAAITGLTLGGNYGGLVQGSTYFDDNGDGQFDGDEETATEPVFLDVNDNGKLDAGEPSQAGDVGEYGFEFNVVPGTHTVRVIADPSKRATVTVKSDGRVYGSIAIAPLRTLDGTLYQDADGDAHRDAGDVAFSNVWVWIDFDGDGKRDSVEPQALSAADGSYHLRSPEDGVSFPIRFASAAGKLTSTAHRKTVSFQNAGQAFHADFGFVVPTSLSITAFLDADKNRKHSKGDAWLAYTIAYLDLDDDGKQDKREPSVITDALGHALFTNVRAGTYTLRLRASSKLGTTRGTTYTVTLGATGQTDVTAAVRVG